MALAIIRYLGTHKGKFRFACDIGTNHFFGLSVGSPEEIEKSGGLPRISARGQRSKIRKLPPQMLGRFELMVPEDSMPQDKKYVQLISFKNKEGFGAAWSEIVKI